jgi:hypothetical protein
MALNIQRARQQGADQKSGGVSNAQVLSGAHTFLGVNIRAGASACRIDFFSGTADSDPLICSAYVAGSKTTTEWFGPGGISAPNGVYMKLNAGTPDATSIFYHVT